MNKHEIIKLEAKISAHSAILASLLAVRYTDDQLTMIKQTIKESIDSIDDRHPELGFDDLDFLFRSSYQNEIERIISSDGIR